MKLPGSGAWYSVLVGALFCCSYGVGAEVSQGPMVGKKAPDFHVQGIYGEAYSLEPFKGHILVMQFGASW